MSAAQPQSPTKDRLLQSATKLFSEKGFEGVSVRQICKDADTSMNMIHHYFGSKEGLFDAILASFTDKVFATPLRVLDQDVQSKAEFVTRLEVFFEETLTALIEQRHLVHMMARHTIAPTAMASLMGNLVSYLATCQAKGYIRAGIDPSMISGFMMDRLANQVLYAAQIKRDTQFDLINDPDYRARWTRSNLELILYGMVSPDLTA
ncbi:MAG: TetR/AcrR family transcriptional regulator [Thalassovita sp.]